MLDTTVLLISADDMVIEAVQGAMKPIAHLRLTVVGSLSEVAGQRAGVILIQLSDTVTAPATTELLRELATMKRPVAALVIGDDRQPDSRILMRAGAADVLSVPVDVERLTHLLDTLTVRARHASAKT